MKTPGVLRIIRFCFTVSVVAGWGGESPTAQEKPKTLLLWQNGGIGQKEQLLDSTLSAQSKILPEPKSEGTALALSLAGTLVPIAVGMAILAQHGFGSSQLTRYYASGQVLYHYEERPKVAVPFALIAGGAIFGPSLGYLYGGQGEHALTGAAIRYGVYVGTVMATQAAIIVTTALHLKPKDRRKIIHRTAAIGGSLSLVAAIVDIVRVPVSVRKRNRVLQANALTITPAYFAQHGAPGVKLQIRF